jgi:hypothetical protein
MNKYENLIEFFFFFILFELQFIHNYYEQKGIILNVIKCN